MAEKPRISLRARAEAAQENHDKTTSEKTPLEQFLGEQLLSNHTHSIGQPIHPALNVDRQHYRPRKKQISIRLDCDVLEWFQSIPGKYQQHINRVCRAYMLANLQHHTQAIPSPIES